MTVYSGDRNNHNHIGKAAKNRNHPVSPQPSAIAGWYGSMRNKQADEFYLTFHFSLANMKARKVRKERKKREREPGC